MSGSYAHNYESNFGFFKDYSREAVFLDKTFRVHGAGVKDVIDIACGPGSHILELARLDYRCAVTDIDPEMLDMVRSAAASRNLGVATYRSDMRSFRLDAHFDAALNMFYSFQNVLFSHEEQLSFFRGVKALLPAGGIFVIELLSEENNIRLYPPGQSFVLQEHRKDDGSIIKVTSTNRTISVTIKEIVLLYETFRPDGSVEREEFVSPIRRVRLSEFEALTHESGFAMSGAYGDCDIDVPFTEDSPKLVAVLRKV